MSVSVVVPTYNELDNVELLYGEIDAVMQKLDRPYEILFVDDGSTDGTTDRLKNLAEQDSHVKVVCFRRNYGQTAAMQAGLQMAQYEAIVTLDGDLQNDPADIPMMLAKLDEGYDLIHGWRKKRQDKWLSRKLPSKMANWLISKTTGFPIHDLGCTLKVIRREIAQELELYGEMHRFIPILAHQRGARCAEVVTNHRARQFGETKYGIGRTFRVVLDLLTVKFLLDYLASPMKCFGKLGLWCMAGGFISGAATTAMKLFAGVSVLANPFLLVSILSMMASLQFLVLGLLGEVVTRIYYGSQQKQHYAIRELVNFEDQQGPVRLAA